MSSSTAVADFTNVANWQGVDEKPTPNSVNLVESGPVWNITSRLYDGTLASTSQHSGILFRNDVVKVGDTVKAKLSNLKADGETFSRDTGIGLFDSNGTRISVAAQINGATSVLAIEATFIIPENFAYAATLWGELTLDYLYTESGLIQLHKLAESSKYYDNFNIVSRAEITFPDKNSVTIGDGYMYIKKGNTITKILLHSNTTYTLNGSVGLIYNITSNAFSVKPLENMQSGEIIALWHDAVVGFNGGLLYKYYQDAKIKVLSDNVNETVIKGVLYDGNKSVTSAASSSGFTNGDAYDSRISNDTILAGTDIYAIIESINSGDLISVDFYADNTRLSINLFTTVLQKFTVPENCNRIVVVARAKNSETAVVHDFVGISIATNNLNAPKTLSPMVSTSFCDRICTNQIDC